MTPEQRTAFTEMGGNALLYMFGVQYYSALGKKSAQRRAANRQAQLAASADSIPVLQRVKWLPRPKARKSSYAS